MIGVDWGTTSFRAFRLTQDGALRDRRSALKGLVNVPDNRFADTLREEIGPWLAAGENHVLLSGMIGSRHSISPAMSVGRPKETVIIPSRQNALSPYQMEHLFHWRSIATQ